MMLLLHFFALIRSEQVRGGKQLACLGAVCVKMLLAEGMRIDVFIICPEPSDLLNKSELFGKLKDLCGHCGEGKLKDLCGDCGEAKLVEAFLCTCETTQPAEGEPEIGACVMMDYAKPHNKTGLT